MKIINIVLLMILAGCTSMPTSKDNLFSCKQACRGQVQKYIDDTIECECKTLKIAQ